MDKIQIRIIMCGAPNHFFGRVVSNNVGMAELSELGSHASISTTQIQDASSCSDEHAELRRVDGQSEGDTSRHVIPADISICHDEAA
jgi:hypothetical protein